MTAVDTSYLQLLSLAVHELRTPAGVVGIYLHMLQGKTDPPLNAGQKQMVAAAEKSCARVVELIDELSQIEKFDAGEAALAREPIDVFALASEAAECVRQDTESADRVIVSGAADAAPIVGDPKRLKSAVQAVLRAVLRETPKEQSVGLERRLGTDVQGRTSARLVIADTARLAAALQAPGREFSEMRGGLGLALPLARRVIEAHGGRLWSPDTGGHSTSNGGHAPSAAVISLPIANQ
jgi:signal transduction histidine kinase